MRAFPPSAEALLFSDRSLGAADSTTDRAEGIHLLAPASYAKNSSRVQTARLANKPPLASQGRIDRQGLCGAMDRRGGSGTGDMDQFADASTAQTAKAWTSPETSGVQQVEHTYFAQPLARSTARCQPAYNSSRREASRTGSNR